jgi:hypothetical protein
MLFSTIDWPGIEALRAKCGGCSQHSLESAAQDFAGLFVDEFESVALVRVFAVLPLKVLPAREHEFATRLVAGDGRLAPDTAVLTLLGTRGLEPEWNDRKASRGHLAIPLLDSRFVLGAPMIAKLLSDLDVDFKGLDVGAPISTRRMLGSRNGTFYVPDARTAQDEHGRQIIAAGDFVASHQIRTVFGMGGAYLDGSLVVAILFTREVLDRLQVERFPSLISNFKMTTAQLQARGQFFSDQA